MRRVHDDDDEAADVLRQADGEGLDTERKLSELVGLQLGRAQQGELITCSDRVQV